jgi:hypothetical protein
MQEVVKVDSRINNTRNVKLRSINNNIIRGFMMTKFYPQFHSFSKENIIKVTTQK